MKRGRHRDESLQNDKKDHRRETPMRQYILSTGFFGGLFASLLAYFAHFMNFIPFGPGIIWQNTHLYMFYPSLKGPWGHLLGMVSVSVISIGVAYAYYYMCRRFNTIWLGIGLGLVVWAIIFLGLNQLIPGTESVRELGWTTNITYVCIFVFYGLFVGYSISYEFNDRILEKEKAMRHEQT
ncbi:YqhR family membrane protein [Caldalkalibacillus salinus]|uniref:YqhR family membrane protein n=1 Tax=Caldalkalibacillus salinus TaxID=2803787 RepID=UPI0019218B8C|nr:YqhR family membrane protein [Caldalkalibacillus salinus]